MNGSTQDGSGLPPEARNWAMGCHLMALTGLLGNGIGFVLGPLIVWLIKRDTHPFIDAQGKEAVNFQLTMIIATIVGVILIFFVVGLILLPLVAIFNVVMTIIAGIKAANGEPFEYPLTIRFLR